MSNDHLQKAWASLGIAFNSEGHLNYNPEKAIIDTVRSGEFPRDKKMFGLMLLWLQNYHNLVHVDRLKILLKELDSFQMGLMGGLATKCLKMGDFRWRTIIREVEKKLKKSATNFHSDSDLFLELKGVDDDFALFGVRVIPVAADNQKKIMSREYILKHNTWLRSRLFLGVNLRADFFTIFSLGLAQNAYQAAKILNCSINTSYRNWSDLKESKELGLFVAQVQAV